MNQAAIITVSDGCHEGSREDRAGRALEELLKKAGWEVAARIVVPDELELIRSAVLRQTSQGHVDLLVTTGGTGIAPRDVTPEAVRPLLAKEIPGFSELMRARGLAITENAALSRSLAGVAGQTLVLVVPGSEAGAVDSLGAVLSLLRHAVDLIQGRTAHAEKLPGG